MSQPKFPPNIEAIAEAYRREDPASPIFGLPRDENPGGSGVSAEGGGTAGGYDASGGSPAAGGGTAPPPAGGGSAGGAAPGTLPPAGGGDGSA